ncbi:putative 2og-fe oxygenase family protein [Neofusicoccum parvum UCRNP2]|uniref:Putative 2og-fe oxygenase family protein n=1 Tax=Botryosphaeria parva (strain UCR-NP2) TaxID=1287680 RepID=R1G830_BOTPV|nr:putative 2og-fe oxygenase family protein [Neofusicoccum parvum UCRNP2]
MATSTPPPTAAKSSSKLTTAAMLLPLLPFGFLQWQNISSKFGLGNVDISMPSFSHAPASNATRFETMAAQYAAGCPAHTFKTHIFSTDPLIIYVEDYLSKPETEYLLDLAVPYYRQSPVSKGYQLEAYDREIRSSMSAVVPDDPVVSCIEARSVEFQGYMPTAHLEDIQVVKYGVSDHFRPHFDWFEGMANPRLSTFFVYLACDDESGPDGAACEGGATQFPHYEGRFPARWCEFIDCEDDSGVGGVAFKPAVGNAVFWENLYPNGTGHPGVWHAGMPVKKGRKVGLNIFTRRDKWVPEQS